MNVENKLNEPKTVYHTQPKLGVFSSHAEANEADDREMAALSPETHLQNTTLLTERVFAEELKQLMDKTIKFKK